MIVSGWTILVAVFGVLGIMGGFVGFLYATAHLVPNSIIAIRKALRTPMGQQTPVAAKKNGHLDAIWTRETADKR